MHTLVMRVEVIWPQECSVTFRYPTDMASLVEMAVRMAPQMLSTPETSSAPSLLALKHPSSFNADMTLFTWAARDASPL